MIQRPLLLLGFVGLAGCIYPHPPPAPLPTELSYAPGCETAGAVPAYGTPASLSGYAGVYALAGTSVTVRSDGARLLLDRPGFVTRPLAPGAAPGEFVDGCGLGYRFAPAGVAARLTIRLADGQESVWTRLN